MKVAMVPPETPCKQKASLSSDALGRFVGADPIEELRSRARGESLGPRKDISLGLRISDIAIVRIGTAGIEFGSHRIYGAEVVATRV